MSELHLSKIFSMRKSILFVGLALIIASCGESPKKENKGFEVTRKKEATNTESSNSEVPVDLSNKGLGPITSYEFSAAINPDLAEKGKSILGKKSDPCVFEFSNPLRIRGSPIWGSGPYHECYTLE